MFFYIFSIGFHIDFCSIFDWFWVVFWLQHLLKMYKKSTQTAQVSNIKCWIFIAFYNVFVLLATLCWSYVMQVVPSSEVQNEFNLRIQYMLPFCWFLIECGSQDGPKILPRSSKKDPRIVKNWSQDGPTFTPRWSKSDQNIAPTLSENDPKMLQK